MLPTAQPQPLAGARTTGAVSRRTNACCFSLLDLSPPRAAGPARASAGWRRACGSVGTPPRPTPRGRGRAARGGSRRRRPLPPAVPVPGKVKAKGVWAVVGAFRGKGSAEDRIRVGGMPFPAESRAWRLRAAVSDVSVAERCATRQIGLSCPQARGSSTRQPGPRACRTRLDQQQVDVGAVFTAAPGQRWLKLGGRRAAAGSQRRQAAGPWPFKLQAPRRACDTTASRCRATDCSCRGRLVLPPLAAQRGGQLGAALLTQRQLAPLVHPVAVGLRLGGRAQAVHKDAQCFGVPAGAGLGNGVG